MRNRRDVALNYCENQKSDFCVLQETHLNIDFYSELRDNWQGDIIIAPGTSQKNGILVLAKNTAPEITSIKTDKNGRFVFFKIKENKDAIAVVYAPSGMSKEKCEERTTFFKNLKKNLRKFLNKSDNLILLGDFNITLGDLDRMNSTNNKCCSQDELKDLLIEFDLEDKWRLQNPRERLYTHYHGATNSYSRLDRAYTSTTLNAEIKISHIINSFSDHIQSVSLDRTKIEFERGRGYWMLNTSLLKNPEFVKEIETLWEAWRRLLPSFNNIIEWWEEGKEHLRTFIKAYTRTTTAKQNKRKNSLKKRLRNLFKKVAENEHLQKIIDKYKSELFQIELKEAQGAKIRTKVKWELEGEKCNKFFFEKLEKKKDANQAIFSLKSLDGQRTLKKQEEIITEIRSFYENLYDEDIEENVNQTVRQNELINKLTKKITTENKKLCEENIKLNEIEKAIRSFDNKTPLMGYFCY